MNTRKFIITTLLSTGITLSSIPSTQAQGVSDQDVVHDMRGNVVRSSFGNCVRTRWMSNEAECGNPQQMSYIEKSGARGISDEDRTLYFGFNKTNLMESENLKLDRLANTLKSNENISGVTIVGYADRIGSADDNKRLSHKRAEVVEKSLRNRGYLNTVLAKTRWLGETASTTQCPNDLARKALISCLQKDRQVTVEINYTNPPSLSSNF